MASRTVVASTSQNLLHNSTWLRHLHNHMNIDEGLSWFTRLLVNYSFLSLRYPFVFSFCFEFSLALPLTSRLRASLGSGTIFFAAEAQSTSPSRCCVCCDRYYVICLACLMGMVFAAGSFVSFYSLLSLVSCSHMQLCAVYHSYLWCL